MQNRIAYGLYPAPQIPHDKHEAKRDWLRILFFALIFILPLWPDFAEVKPGGIPNIAPTRLVRAAVIILALFSLFSDRERAEIFFRRLRENWVPLTLLLAYFALRFASTFIARIPILEFIVFIKNDFWSYLSIFFIGLLVIKDERDVKRVLLLLVFSGGVVGCVSAVEFFLKRNIFQGIVNVTSDYVLSVLSDKTRDNTYRVQGTFEHPLSLGQFFAMILPWCWFSFAYSSRLSLKLIGFVSGILGAAAIYACGSRSSLAVVVPLLSVMFIWELWRWTLRSHNRPAQYLVLLQFPMILAIFLAVLFYLKKIAVGTSAVTQGSAAIRIEMLKAGASKITDALFFGHGFGDATSVVTFVGSGGVKTLDNFYLLVALESGIFAVLLVCALWMYFVVRSFAISRNEDTEVARLGMMLFLATFSYAVIMTIHSLQGLSWLMYLMFACIIVLKEKRAK